MDERPTYGYRRITALVNRELAVEELPAVNRKRVHRIMQQATLVLEHHTGRCEGRVHDGNPLPDATTVLRQIAGWIDDYNEIHSHSVLRMRSPREFIRAQTQTEPDFFPFIRHRSRCSRYRVCGS
ncbi:IS3 family transposase [Chelativorans sp. J32]|uniref:IS3 family transposase n=1 Tax=Chelativorans sp. J32 TaxID=935840 RepID=UPI0004AE8001